MPALGLTEELNKAGGWTPSLRAALDEFLSCARTDEWSCYNFEPNNFLVADDAKGGKRFYHCEYVSKRMMLNAFPFYRRRKKEKRIEEWVKPLLNYREEK